VVSDDLTMYLPEKINQFDAIVMNNSSGPWIQPTDKDMETILESPSFPDEMPGSKWMNQRIAKMGEMDSAECQRHRIFYLGHFIVLSNHRRSEGLSL
jgi:hypothetical protein